MKKKFKLVDLDCANCCLLYTSAPDLVITSIVEDIPTIIASLPGRIEDGIFGGLWTVKLDDHIKYLADYASFVPDDVKAELDDLYDKLVSGEIEVEERYE